MITNYSSPDKTLTAFVVVILITSLAVTVLITALLNSTLWLVPLTLIGLMWIYFILKFFRPQTIDLFFVVFPLLFPVIPGALGVWRYMSWFALLWVIGIFLVSYIYLCHHNWKHQWVKTHYALVFILYSIVFILATLANPLNHRALSFVLQTLPLIFVYWTITQFLSGYDLNRLMYAYIIGALINALVFIYAFFSQGMSTYTLAGFAFGFMRPIIWGVKANSWPYPSMIALAILLVIVVHNKPKGKDWWWIIPTGVVLFAIVIINMSRSVLLGIFVSSVFIFLTHPKTRRLLLAGIVSIGVIIMATLPLIWPFIDNLLRLRAGLTGRGQIWRMTIRMISEHPLFGIGPANYKERFIFESPFMRNGIIMELEHPTAHNVFLHVAAEIGIIGALISFSLILLFFIRSYILWPKLKGTKHFAVLVAITAVLIAAFSRSLFETELALQHGYLYKNLLIVVLLAIQDQLSARADQTL